MTADNSSRAIAAAEALDSLGLTVNLKWPNDLQSGGRKLGGILVETRETPSGPTAVVGLGLNVSLRVDELPAPHATSLVLEHAKAADRDTVLRAVLTDGYALGVGLELALACDFRVAADDAELGLPEIKLGMIPGSGGTQRLARLVGKAKAIELMATGRLMTMNDAHRLGLVTEVWGPDELQGRSFNDAVMDYAKQFTPPHKASRAVGRMKRAVQSGAEAGFTEGLAIERELQQLLFQGEDAAEGIAANLEKRRPEFKGR